MSPRALYLHFSSRGELLATLTRSLGETESLAESLDAVWDAPDAASALDEWARHIGRAHPRILAIGTASSTTVVPIRTRRRSGGT